MTDEQPTTPLGAFIKQQRLDLGLSIARAAKKADISDTKWSQLEKGKKGVGRDVSLKKVADALNLQPEELFNLAGRQWDGSPSTEPTRAEMVSRLEALEADVAELRAELARRMPRGVRDHGEGQ